MTPRTQSSSASVSVSVTPRRHAGERIPNVNVSTNNTANVSISGANSRDNDSTSIHSGHRKRAIRDSRFPSNSSETDSERAPKRTARAPVTVKTEIAQEDEPAMSISSSGCPQTSRERQERKGDNTVLSGCSINENLPQEPNNTVQPMESPVNEVCSVSSSVADGSQISTRRSRQVITNGTIDNRNKSTSEQQPGTSIKKPSTTPLLIHKGEPSKPNGVKTENMNTLEDLQSQGYSKMKSPKKTIPKGDNQSLRKETDSVPDVSRDCLDIENNTASAAIPSESPQPGPSGLQQSNSNQGDNGEHNFEVLQNAPDLQLDCLSSDTEDEVNEDVTVVKISRRRKGTSRKRWSAAGRSHNEHGGSTTTINAPPGTVVEVDLTQESDTDENEIHVDAIHPPPQLSGPHASASYPNHYSMNCVTTDSNDESPNRLGGGIKLRRFATAPHGALPPNVQSAGSSRGSTPSSTPGPSSHAAATQNISSNVHGNPRTSEGNSNSHTREDRYYDIDRIRLCNYSNSRAHAHSETNQPAVRSHRSCVSCNGEYASLPSYHEPTPAHNPSNSTSHSHRHNQSSSPQPQGASTSRHSHNRHLSHSRSSQHLDNTHSSRISNPSFDQWTFRPRRLRPPEGSIAPSASTNRSTSSADGNVHQSHSLHHGNLHLQQQPHVPNDCPDAHCQLHQNPGSVVIVGSPPREFHRPSSSNDSSRTVGNTQQTLHRAHQSTNPVQQQTQPVDFRRSSSTSRSSTDTARESTETVAPVAATTNRSRGEASNQPRNSDTASHTSSNHHLPPPPYPSDASDLLRPYHQIALPPSSPAFDSSSAPQVPPRDQRLLNAVWRMQYHPLRSNRHPRHQRLWTSHQMQQEQMRRHMASAAGAASNAPSAANETEANLAQPSVELGRYCVYNA